jgi:hypothetical protein
MRKLFLLPSLLLLFLSSCNFDELKPYVGTYSPYQSPMNCWKLQIAVANDSKKMKVLLQDYGLFGQVYEFTNQQAIKGKRITGEDALQKVKFETQQKISFTDSEITVKERTKYTGFNNYDTGWYDTLQIRKSGDLVTTKRVRKALINQQVRSSDPLECTFRKSE